MSTRPQIPKQCAQCGASFYADRKTGRFCSRSCYSIYSTKHRIRNKHYGECSVDGCQKPLTKGVSTTMCVMHHQRWYRYGRLSKYIPQPQITDHGYRTTYVNGYRQYEHIAVAEKALGRRLPQNACVHHIDGNPLNNDPSNLVICPDTSYHHMLHRRERALHGGGDPSYRKCDKCKQWDDPCKMLRFKSASTKWRHYRYRHKQRNHRCHYE